ncbi:MAG TPA: hypothetical protein VFH45_09915 [Acidimicrobiales bacterium]|nr:hypothetical protein [Acidimicrobiales bacterium]
MGAVHRASALAARAAVATMAGTAWLVASAGTPTAAATAACPPPAITVSPSAAAAGSTVTVRGTNWATGCSGVVVPGASSTVLAPLRPLTGIEVALAFSGAQPTQRVLTTVNAASDHTFTTRVVIPALAPPAGYSTSIVAFTTGPLASASAPFTILGGPAPTATGGAQAEAASPPAPVTMPPSTSASRLPRTGAQSGGMAGLGAGLVASGWMLLGSSRQRRVRNRWLPTWRAPSPGRAPAAPLRPPYC